MYLPQIKEEVDKIAGNKKILIILIVLLITVAGAGGWLLCRHYDAIERANSNDVITTVRNTHLDGTVDAIATDHAPHTAEDKANGSPGLVGLETGRSDRNSARRVP